MDIQTIIKAMEKYADVLYEQGEEEKCSAVTECIQLINNKTNDDVLVPEEMAQEMIDEASYERGSRMAYREMLGKCVKELGYDGDKASEARWIIERERAISALRDICSEYGDNDWKENLSLDDIISKHLHRNLEHKL